MRVSIKVQWTLMAWLLSDYNGHGSHVARLCLPDEPCTSYNGKYEQHLKLNCRRIRREVGGDIKCRLCQVMADL